MKRIVALLASALLVAAACLTEAPGVLIIDLAGVPPDTTTRDSVQITGEVVRSPPKASAVSTVFVEVNGDTVRDYQTNDFRVFNGFIPLARVRSNTVRLLAEDDTGAVSDPLQFTIVHREETPIAPGY